MVSLGASNFDRRNTRRHRLLCLDLSSKRNTALVLFSGTLLSVVLLTARYRLAHPDDHPYGSAGSSIGAQSYAPSFHWAIKPTLAAGESDKAAESGSGDYDDDYETGDGWLDEPQDWLAALTANKWEPQANNSRPLTELTVKSCVLPPGLYDLCAPVSSKKVRSPPRLPVPRAAAFASGKLTSHVLACRKTRFGANGSALTRTSTGACTVDGLYSTRVAGS